MLSDLGYDVWLWNNRGNGISFEHINKKEYNSAKFGNKYWDFSYDEMAIFDLTAMI